MTPKIEQFLRGKSPDTPCLVVDLNVVEEYQRLRRALPLAEIHYAVKANPAAPVAPFGRPGFLFDAASMNEIERCLATGADASRVSCNTIGRSPISSGPSRLACSFRLIPRKVG